MVADMLSRIEQFFRPAPLKTAPPPAARLMPIKIVAAQKTEGADRVELSNSSAWSSPGDWEPVVALIGTGVEADHPDLHGRVIGGISFGGGSPFEPSHPQGTHLAGVIAGNRGPSDDWRVGAAKILHPHGEYETQNFVDLRSATKNLPAEMAPVFCDRMAADWHLQGRDSLELTRQVAASVSLGKSPDQAYRVAKAAGEVEMHLAEELVQVGDFALERN